MRAGKVNVHPEKFILHTDTYRLTRTKSFRTRKRSRAENSQTSFSIQQSHKISFGTQRRHNISLILAQRNVTVNFAHRMLRSIADTQNSFRTQKSNFAPRKVFSCTGKSLRGQKNSFLTQSNAHAEK